MGTITSAIRQPAKTWIFLLVMGTFVSAAFSRVAFDYFMGAVFFTMLFYAAFKIEGVRFSNLFIKTGFNWVWPLWVLVIAFSLIFNHWFDIRAIDQVLRFRWILGMFFFARALQITGVEKWAIQLLGIATGVVCIFLLWRFFNYPEIPGTPFWPNRFKGFYFNPNDFGHSFSLVLAFAFAIGMSLLKDSSWGVRLSLIAAVVAASAGVFLTYSRISWLIVVVMMLLTIFTTNRKYFYTLLAFLSLVAVMLFYTNFAEFRDRVLFTFQKNANGDWQDGRYYIWKAYIQMFLDHPFFGVGYFRNVDLLPQYYNQLRMPQAAEVTHAHNQYFQWLITTGIVGFSVYCTIFYYFIRNLLKKSANVFTKPVLFSFIAFFIGGMVDSNFDIKHCHSYLMMIFALALFVIGSQSVNNNNADQL